jgi:adenylylsulfate kinase-like enzyme
MAWAIWITGPPAGGKTTLAQEAAAALASRGIPVSLLELDGIRAAITPPATYPGAERDVVDRALAYMAKLLVEAGVRVIVDATAQRRAGPQSARELIPVFAEVELRSSPAMGRPRAPTRRSGNAPTGAGEPNATVAEVATPDQSAADAELTLDTTTCDPWTQVQEVVYLARRLERRARAEDSGGGRVPLCT